MMKIEMLQNTLKTLGNGLKAIKQSQRQIEESYKKNQSAKPNVLEPEASNENGTNTLPVLVQSRNTVADVDANFIPAEIIRMGEEIEELFIKFDLISAIISKHEATTVKLDSEIDNLEQYGRRNCLILHGLDNFSNAHYNYNDFVEFIINIINSKLNLGLTTSSVDIALPLPKSSNGRIPVIIKSIKRSDRNAIFARKRLFVKSGLTITKSLSPTQRSKNSVRTRKCMDKEWNNLL